MSSSRSWATLVPYIQNEKNYLVDCYSSLYNSLSCLHTSKVKESHSTVEFFFVREERHTYIPLSLSKFERVFCTCSQSFLMSLASMVFEVRCSCTRNSKFVELGAPG